MNDKAKKNQPGEMIFTLCLLALGAFLLHGSIGIYQEDPQLSAAGGLPLILSILLVAVGAVIFLQNIRNRKQEETHYTGKEILHLIFPRDVVIFVVLLILYCVGLMLGLGFYPCTFVFMIAAMSFMNFKGWKWNLITTVILLVTIYVAFTLIFKVQLP